MTEISSIRYKRLLLTTSLLVLVAAILSAGCTVGERTPAKTETLLISGSTTVLPVAQLTAEAFMAKNPDVDLQISGGGSSVGIQAAGSGTADIGMASRDLKESEKEAYPDLVKHVVALDGIVIIVNPENSLGSLTLDEVRGIYNGTYRNWNDLGGPDQEIVVTGRDSASGTREFFHETVMQKEDFVETQLEKNSNGAVKQTVAQTPGAIGYVGLGYIDASVKALPIDAGSGPVEPTIENIEDGTYPIARELFMFTRGEPTGLAAEYLSFISSPEGQQIIRDEGFVPA
ncbi:ABC-type phosphate transport system, periplasmic component [Methanoculleus bourgensis MS2]|jgi:phosphate transport system substrate-binding protein|uniref:ABC-type phosphate transport system, periplasmic component n=1 Tax=Methanoculleus bourgensis (strain ATCC 43281 / DSM 3045 / OCM 15 / MS2) TaxID=1201294 RepID=I7LLM7_METBM|nr:phosphate ABC transporter substrate-binding protein [Methanoculleus bourgensis]CCJ35489.1 ABC-type phosphate transport system, periplasmic component [Methanoculleus bourgensis MS2]